MSAHETRGWRDGKVKAFWHFQGVLGKEWKPKLAHKSDDHALLMSIGKHKDICNFDQIPDDSGECVG